MLARAHRITSGDDYRFVVRRGARSGVRGLTVSALQRSDPASPTRFGFIVSKRVGVAVVRNRIRRRLKSISLNLLRGEPESIATGLDIVYRLHPESSEWTFEQLETNAMGAVHAAVRKARRS